MRLVSVVVASLFALVALPAAAQTGTLTSTEPGATDPQGAPSNYTLFADDELWTPHVDKTSTSLYDLSTFLPNGSLQLGNPVEQTTGIAAPTSLAPQVAAAAGRITEPERDQVAFAAADSSRTLQVYLADQDTAGARSASLGTLQARQAGYTDFVDVAVGDLDKLPDSDGNNHDEVVTTWVDGNGQVQLGVLNYTSTSSDASKQPASTTQVQVADGLALGGVAPVDNVVAVALGDLDGLGPGNPPTGSGADDIAVAYLATPTQINVATYSYDVSGSSPALKLDDTYTLGVVDTNLFSGTLDLASGDWDGNGDGELVLAWSGFDPASGSTSSNPKGQADYGFLLLDSDTSLELKATQIKTFGLVSATGSNEFPRVQVARGLFAYDPANGYDFGRDQFVIAHNDPDQTLLMSAWKIPSTLTNAQSMFTSGSAKVTNPSNNRHAWSIAPGDFVGTANTNDPTWQVGFGTATAGATQNCQTVGIVTVPAGSTAATASPTPAACAADARAPAVAYDYDGDSTYLGAPVHLTVEDVIQTDAIVEEPPKHAYYDNNPAHSAAPNDTYGQIIDISRFTGFNWTMSDQQGVSYQTEKQSTASETTGGSQSATASATVKLDESDGLESASEQFSASVGAKLGYSQTEAQSKANSNYASANVSFSCSTEADDCLVGSTSDVDIWRYRIYGTTVPATADASNGYLDVVIPGETYQWPATAGLDTNWYQPSHENGNVLSYPQAATNQPANPYTPPDLGTFESSQNGTVDAPMIQPTQYAWDGTAATLGLSYSYGASSSDTRTTSHQLTESADLKLSYKTSVKVGAAGDSAEGTFNGSVKTTFDADQSWSTSHTATSTSNSTSGITLTKPSGASTLAYNFFPTLYVTDDGTTKVAAATDPLGVASSENQWAQIYGGKADPALSLPNRFVPYYGPTGNQTGYQINSDQTSARELRGFQVLDETTSGDPTTSDPTNAGDPLSDPPLAGDQVALSAPVWNYSTARAASNVPVQFELIGYDGASGSEQPLSGCPNSTTPTRPGRCVIGSTTLQSIAPRGSQTASVIWDTTGYGPGVACGSSDYRVYVEVDPQATIDETYPPEDPTKQYPYVDPAGNSETLNGIDPGQNNEGWGYASVTQPSSSGQCGGSSDVALSAVPPTGGAAKATAARGRPIARRLRALQGGEVVLQLKSKKRHRDARHVLLFDGDPKKGGKAIGYQIVRVGNLNDNYVRFPWTPRKAGTHDLHAIVLPRQRERNRDDNRIHFTVDVGKRLQARRSG